MNRIVATKLLFSSESVAITGRLPRGSDNKEREREGEKIAFSFILSLIRFLSYHHRPSAALSFSPVVRESSHAAAIFRFNEKAVPFISMTKQVIRGKLVLAWRNKISLFAICNDKCMKKRRREGFYYFISATLLKQS